MPVEIGLSLHRYVLTIKNNLEIFAPAPLPPQLTTLPLGMANTRAV